MIRQILAMGCMVIAASSIAQTTDPYEEFKRKREQEMKVFEQDYKRGLDSLRDAQNRDFALLLEGKWSEREVEKAPPVLEKPKPDIPPAVEDEKPAEVPAEPLALPDADDDSNEDEAPSEEPEQEQQQQPDAPQQEQQNELSHEGSYQMRLEKAAGGLSLAPSIFFGNATWIPAYAAWPVCERPLGATTIATYWKKCSEKSVDGYLSYLSMQRELLQLSDWGMLKMVQQWSKQWMNDANDATLFSWFLLVQLGYDVRLMYTGNGASLAYPFEGMFYGRSYIEMNGVNYYLLDNNSERSLYTYDGSHAGAKRVFTLHQNGRTVFPENISNHSFEFVFNGKKHLVEVPYNRHRSDYYASIPQTELSFYFDDRGANDFEAGCNTRLRSMIDVLPTQREKIRFLYAMVCAGIPYATDQEQFGYEKFCIPEEALHYSHADCEDRTFLLNYLIRTFVGAPTIGLNYPGHVAMAVMLDDVRSTDARFNYKNQTWVFCDPTYIGADVGMMPGVYESQTPEVFE